MLIYSGTVIHNENNEMGQLMEIIAARNFNLAYIILDSLFLLVYAGLLLCKKRRLTFLWGVFGAILYIAVDYGIFHLLTHARSITGADMFWVLLWMSISYGFTNFTWIWLALKRDEYLKEWSVLIFVWWVACPILSQMFPSASIHIERTTNAYHGIMGAILFLSYLAAIIYNLTQSDKSTRFNILRLFTIGVLAQLGWEFSLLISGIRSDGFSVEQKIITLVVNSLVETNLGLPAIYLIFLAITSKITEDLTPTNKTIKNRLRENNAQKPFIGSRKKSARPSG